MKAPLTCFRKAILENDHDQERQNNPSLFFRQRGSGARPFVFQHFRLHVPACHIRAPGDRSGHFLGLIAFNIDKKPWFEKRNLNAFFLAFCLTAPLLELPGVIDD